MAPSDHTSRPKVLAVASLGGHWIQLLRIARALEQKYDIEYMCTDAGAKATVGDSPLHLVRDFSRWNPLGLIPAACAVVRTLRRIRPVAVISTGAAPGLVTVAIARAMGIRTIWVDSVANAATLSGSGKMAARIAGRTFTQWPSVACPPDVIYAGSVFGKDTETV